MNCAEEHDLRVSLEANWNWIRALGCDRQFAGQWIVTDKYRGQLGSLSKPGVASLVKEASM